MLQKPIHEQKVGDEMDDTTGTDTSDYDDGISSPRFNINKQNYIVCWDFDWSLINQNSDYYAHEKLYGSVEYTQKMYPSLRQKAAQNGVTLFTDFMDQVGWPKIFNEFNLNCTSFSALISDIPIYPQNLSILNKINQHSADNNNGKSLFNINQYIISNANQVLIDIILRANNLNGNVFKSDQIFTNSGWYDEKTGILRCKSYHGDLYPHKCNVGCSLNLCKGKVLKEEVLIRHNRTINNNCIIYIGDGGNDYCAVNQLNENDYAFVRQFNIKKGLEERIEKEGGITALKCNVLYWKNGMELENNFKKVVPDLF